MTDKCPPHQRFTTNWLAASARMLRIGLSDVGGDVFAILDLSGAGYDAKKDAGIFLTCAEKSTNSQLNLPHGNKKHEIEDVCLAPPLSYSGRVGVAAWCVTSNTTDGADKQCTPRESVPIAI